MDLLGLMKRLSQFASFTLALAFVAPAFAGNDAYNSGYDFGRQIGRFVKQYTPSIGMTLAIAAIGLACWLVARRPRA